MSGRHENGFANLERRDCECCDATGTVSSTLKIERFPYGAGDDAVMLEARVPVWTCASCEDAYTDGEAEEARHEAVCLHLGRPTPKELKEFRASRGLTQKALAVMGDFGIASIKRWEGAVQVPSASAAATLRRIMMEEARKPFVAPKFRTTFAEPVLRLAQTFRPSFGCALPEAA